jgi:hypothetical protein
LDIRTRNARGCVDDSIHTSYGSHQGVSKCLSIYLII